MKLASWALLVVFLAGSLRALYQAYLGRSDATFIVCTVGVVVWSMLAGWGIMEGLNAALRRRKRLSMSGVKDKVAE